jgi:manganese-dependent inorganic pyrophosphatase
MILMLTDVLLEGTQIIFLGNADDIPQPFGVEPQGNTLFLPGVMSRKKQIVPTLSLIWG